LKGLGALAVIHPAFAFPPSLAQAPAAERLAVIAALMGPAGGEFLAGLNLSRRETAALAELAGRLRERT